MREPDFEELRELRARQPELIAAYPHDGDVAAAVDAACALVHDVTVAP